MTEDDDITELEGLVESAEDHRDRASELIGEAQTLLQDAIAEDLDIGEEFIAVEHSGGMAFTIHVSLADRLDTLAEELPATVDHSSEVTIDVYEPLARADSETERDRIKGLKHLIEVLEDEHDEGAPVDRVLTLPSAKLDLTRSVAEREVENLRRKGEVYEPRTDYLRTT